MINNSEVHHVSFRCASGFHTSASPVIVFIFGRDFAASFPERDFSFLPWPFLLRPSTPSASSAAALSNPRSAKPSRRRAARATRYRVLTRAGAGVRLGRLRAGDDEKEVVEALLLGGRESESETALLVLQLLSPALLA